MKNIIQKLKLKAKKLKSEIVVLYYVYKNPKTGLMPKILIIIAIGYALSPIDLIPDFIPVLGYLDDLIILPVLIFLAIYFIPENIIEEAKKEAIKNPIKLKDNWIFGVIFVLIWIILLFFIARFLYNFFRN